MSDERDRHSYENYDEEYATEITPDHVGNHVDRRDATSGGVTAGFLAVAASVIAMFMMPVILGIVGIVLGAYASEKGAKGLGITAIILGVITAGAALLYRTAIMALFFSMF